MSAVPNPDPDAEITRVPLPGEVANPANVPPGCPFHPRCGYAQATCRTAIPEWREIADRHYAACHFAHELSLSGVEEGQ